MVRASDAFGNWEQVKRLYDESQCAAVEGKPLFTKDGGDGRYYAKVTGSTALIFVAKLAEAGIKSYLVPNPNETLMVGTTRVTPDDLLVPLSDPILVRLGLAKKEPESA